MRWRGQVRVESIVSETPSVKTFRFRSPGGGPLPFTFLPGQFLNVASWIGGARMNRSDSISSSPDERGYVEMIVKREKRGAVSRRVADLLKLGDTIIVGGPFGTFTFTGAEADSIVLLSASVGITRDDLHRAVSHTISKVRWSERRKWRGPLRPAEALLNCATCHQTKDRHRGLFGNDCAQCHQAPPSHSMMHFQMISMKVACQPNAKVSQCFLCHQTTSWNDSKGGDHFKHH